MSAYVSMLTVMAVCVVGTAAASGLGIVVNGWLACRKRTRPVAIKLREDRQGAAERQVDPARPKPTSSETAVGILTTIT